MLAIVAKPIDVPPKVIARIYRLIELRRAIKAATACRPDKAAIGTPGPGWTLPPARKRFSICVSALERWNELIHPWVA
jgi:hypothetical protein